MKAICIDTTYTDILTLNEVYDVEQSDDVSGCYSLICDDGIAHNLRKNRFKLITNSLKGKCIDNSRLNLTLGEIYQLDQSKAQSNCWLVRDDEGIFIDAFKTRFSLIDEQAAIKTQPRMPAVKQSDADDWKTWAKSSDPNQCPCGSRRGVCSYHP